MTKLSRLTCEETFRRLDDYIDRALSAEEIRQVEEHLATCAECAGEYRFEGAWMEELRKKLMRLQLPDGLVQRIGHELARAKVKSS